MWLTILTQNNINHHLKKKKKSPNTPGFLTSLEHAVSERGGAGGGWKLDRLVRSKALQLHSHRDRHLQPGPLAPAAGIAATRASSQPGSTDEASSLEKPTKIFLDPGSPEAGAIPAGILFYGIGITAHTVAKRSRGIQPLNPPRTPPGSLQVPLVPPARPRAAAWGKTWHRGERARRTWPCPSRGYKDLVCLPSVVPVALPDLRWWLHSPRLESRHLSGLRLGLQKEQAAESWPLQGGAVRAKFGASSQMYTPLGLVRFPKLKRKKKGLSVSCLLVNRHLSYLWRKKMQCLSFLITFDSARIFKMCS